MKKNVKLGVGIAGLFLMGIIALGIAEKNDLLKMKSIGHEKYYLQIKEDGAKNLDIDFPYYYKQEAYSKKGKKITVEFYANKNLNMNSYICVETQSESSEYINSVKGYEEVKESDVPKKAMEQIKENS